jgi:hypothetical protein
LEVTQLRDPLAERLLAKVMAWEPADVARERPDLQAMAAYKYDEYQQFSPGMRFVESLALWLNQFKTLAERKLAYDFIKSKLVFYSIAEMNHFVDIAYPDLIRPILLRRTAEEAGYNQWQLAKAANNIAFQMMQRQTLFLGLSDGARTDIFRRSNPELSHEQFWQTYELPDERASDLQLALTKYIQQLDHKHQDKVTPKFRTVVLLDDFSASGVSYIRLEGKLTKGKIGTFARDLANKKSTLHKLVDTSDLHVIVLLYVATHTAYEYIDHTCKQMWRSTGIKYSTLAVHTISDSVRILNVKENPIQSLIQNYYDHSVYDRHMEKGGTSDARFGFAACGLPVVLSHNSPNNSIALLWSFETCTIRGLFPRVSRHKATP